MILTGIGPEARRSVPAVMKCLEDKEPEVRLQAALALSYLGPDALLSLPALRKLLRDRSTEVRIEAAGTILRLKPPSEEALVVLLDGIRDRESDRRLQAIAAIRWLGLTEKRVVGALLATVKGDADELVRSRARTCMEKLAPPAAWVVPVLDIWLGDRSEEVRVTAAWQLGAVKDSQLAVPSLLRALRDPSAGVRAAAAEALGSHGKGAVAALPTLTKVSQDDLDIHVRYKAACVVAQIERAQEPEKPKGEDPAPDPPSRQKED